MSRTIRTALLLIALLPLSMAAQPQADREAARALAAQSISATDNGDLDRGMELMDQALALDSGNVNLKYEKAYIHVKKQEFKKAMAILIPLLEQPGAEDLWYQMLGNCYDYVGDPKKAVATYAEGLRRFPNSGRLHLEMGIIALGRKDYDKAIEIWEEGIQRAPRYPSNYYWAAKLFCNSAEPLWGVLYGEIFMHLETRTKRTAEISELLYKTYAKSISLWSDSSAINFLKELMVRMPENPKDFVLPFTMRYTRAMLLGCTIGIEMGPRKKIEMSIPVLHRIRERFLQTWFSDTAAAVPANVLFDFQRRVMDAGHLEAYDWQIFAFGDLEGFKIWRSENPKKLEALGAWWEENGIAIDDEHYFSRLKVE